MHKLTINFASRSLSRHFYMSQSSASGFLFLICLSLGQAWAAQDHDLPNGKPPQSGQGPRRGTGQGNSDLDSQEGCRIAGGTLANIANGEDLNLQPVVTFLTSPPCIVNSKKIAQAAIAEGVQFNTMPFRLDTYAKNYSRLSVEGAEKTDQTLLRIIPPIMRDHPMSVQQQIPIIAQFSLLSRSTGLWALGNLVKQELIAGSSLITDSPKQEGLTNELARSLLKMGAAETAVADELAASIEEMALAAQADSLGKIISSLANVSVIEPSLVPTFNQSAGAFNRGVKKGKPFYGSEETRSLAAATVSGAKASIGGPRTMEVGMAELNEAFGSLLYGKTVQSAGIKKLWKEIVRALALSPLFPNLADAIALSLTEQVVYLEKRERELMFAAAKNYPAIALSIQKHFLNAWSSMWGEVHDGKINTKHFNYHKQRFFEPIVAEMLELESNSIDPIWLKEVLHRNLVKDEDIERRFPKFVLSFIEKREGAIKENLDKEGVEPTLTMMAENMAILWTLSNIHVPALKHWVIKYDE